MKKTLMFAALAAALAAPAVVRAEQPQELGVTYTNGKPGTHAPTPVVDGSGKPIMSGTGVPVTSDGRGTSSAGSGGGK